MNFEHYLTVNAQRVEHELDKLGSEFLSEAKKLSPKLAPLAQQFVDACQGGKRIRGTLVKLGYEMAKGQKMKEIYKVGAALEMLHTAILVHDDIMDKSPIRRGQPSLYTSVGVDQAINLGDLGFFLAIKIISESKFSDKEKSQALHLLSKTMVDTAVGQILDIEKGDPMVVARLKTAQYTITGPLVLGTILGGLGPTSPRLRGIKEFGENLGIAFQLRDDILDGEAKEQSLSDVLEYADQAKKIIPKITGNPSLRQLLGEMTDYMIERTK